MEILLGFGLLAVIVGVVSVAMAWDSFEHEGFVFSGAVVAVLGAFAVLIGGANMMSARSCRIWADRNGYEYNYSAFADGCQIHLDGQWIAAENIIVTDERE